MKFQTAAAIAIGVVVIVAANGGTWWELQSGGQTPLAGTSAVTTIAALGDGAAGDGGQAAPATMGGATSAPALEAPLPVKRKVSLPLKVGLMVSQETGEELGKSHLGKPYGYGSQVYMRLKELRSDDVQLYPIIEPGEQSAKLKAVLAEALPDHEPIDGSDAKALAGVSVIMTSNCLQEREAVLDAIEKAVHEEGIGLLNIGGLGLANPGPTPTVLHLAGLKEGQYGWNPKTVPCELLMDHEILGSMWSDEHTLEIMPNGLYGIPLEGSQLLIKVTSMDSIHPVGKGVVANPAYMYYPLLVSKWGKGTIISCQWAPYMKTPAAIQGATDSAFYVKCMKWLAEQPQEAK